MIICYSYINLSSISSLCVFRPPASYLPPIWLTYFFVDTCSPPLPLNPPPYHLCPPVDSCNPHLTPRAEDSVTMRSVTRIQFLSSVYTY